MTQWKQGTAPALQEGGHWGLGLGLSLAVQGKVCVGQVGAEQPGGPVLI